MGLKDRCEVLEQGQGQRFAGPAGTKPGPEAAWVVVEAAVVVHPLTMSASRPFSGDAHQVVDNIASSRRPERRCAPEASRNAHQKRTSGRGRLRPAPGALSMSFLVRLLATVLGMRSTVSPVDQVSRAPVGAPGVAGRLGAISGTFLGRRAAARQHLRPQRACLGHLGRFLGRLFGTLPSVLASILATPTSDARDRRPAGRGGLR